MKRSDRLIYVIALIFGALPLWVSRHLPIVDLPQHLHLISVLHRINDPSTVYPKLFAIRTELTPYLGYYYVVSLLNWLLPLELANKVFLSAYVIGMPLSLAFLLRSLGRPSWPSLLALPFAYGDSFAWGFINYCSALPIAFLCCGLAVRAVADLQRRRAWSIGLSVALAIALLFHVQVFAFLALALPFLFIATCAPDDPRGPELAAIERAKRFLFARGPAAAATLPALAIFSIWVVARIGEPTEVEYGVPWKAWGPLLSSSNLGFKSFAQNREDFFGVLANVLRDGSDRYALYAVVLVAAVTLAMASLPTRRERNRSEGLIERSRMLVLGLIALALYFALPFDIRGYMYYLNTRYAHLAAALLICAVPRVQPAISRVLLASAAICAIVLSLPLARGFLAFGRDASALDRLAALCTSAPMIMGLIFDPFSPVATHPVYLHSAALLALERGGGTNFSFARTAHSPVRYRIAPPPTFPSEWRPDQFDYSRQGAAYNFFLIRGASPKQIFDSLLGSELELAGQAERFYLVRRR